MGTSSMREGVQVRAACSGCRAARPRAARVTRTAASAGAPCGAASSSEAPLPRQPDCTMSRNRLECSASSAAGRRTGLPPSPGASSTAGPRAWRPRTRRASSWRQCWRALEASLAPAASGVGGAIVRRSTCASARRACGVAFVVLWDQSRGQKPVGSEHAALFYPAGTPRHQAPAAREPPPHLRQVLGLPPVHPAAAAQEHGAAPHRGASVARDRQHAAAASAAAAAAAVPRHRLQLAPGRRRRAQVERVHVRQQLLGVRQRDAALDEQQAVLWQEHRRRLGPRHGRGALPEQVARVTGALCVANDWGRLIAVHRPRSGRARI
jgi:hypothetical protein